MLSSLQNLISQVPLLIILYLVFVLLNILDGHSTWLVIQPHHYSRERNPIARWIFRKLGIPRGIVIFKVVLLVILAAAFSIYALTETFILNIILLVADLVFLLVVLHNYKVYKKISGNNPFFKR